MNDIPDPFTRHFGEESAKAICEVLTLAKSYSEGDAFAGAKLSKMGPDQYEALQIHFDDAGFDVNLGKNRMSLVDFVSDPNTDDEELNEAIKQL